MSCHLLHLESLVIFIHQWVERKDNTKKIVYNSLITWLHKTNFAITSLQKRSSAIAEIARVGGHYAVSSCLTPFPRYSGLLVCD